MHRDAEREPIAKREEEIREALARSPTGGELPVVCVIPVRMQEAWLLIDKDALRRAAGTPDGRQPLRMPDVKRLEDLPDPKQTLHELLRQASGHRGRRLRRFDRDMGRCVHRVAKEIRDYSRLRARTRPGGRRSAVERAPAGAGASAERERTRR